MAEVCMCVLPRGMALCDRCAGREHPKPISLTDWSHYIQPYVFPPYIESLPQIAPPAPWPFDELGY